MPLRNIHKWRHPLRGEGECISWYKCMTVGEGGSNLCDIIYEWSLRHLNTRPKKHRPLSISSNWASKNWILNQRIKNKMNLNSNPKHSLFSAWEWLGIWPMTCSSMYWLLSSLYLYGRNFGLEWRGGPLSWLEWQGSLDTSFFTTNYPHPSSSCKLSIIFFIISFVNFFKVKFECNITRSLNTPHFNQVAFFAQ